MMPRAGGSPCARACGGACSRLLILTSAAWGMASFVEILGVDGLSYLDITQTAVFHDPAAVAVAVFLDPGRRRRGAGVAAAAAAGAVAAAGRGRCRRHGWR